MKRVPRLVRLVGFLGVVVLTVGCGPLMSPFMNASVAVNDKWLQVLGAAKPPHIDHRIGHQFHAVVAPLDALEPQQQPLEFVLPGKRPLHALS